MDAFLMSSQYQSAAGTGQQFLFLHIFTISADLILFGASVVHRISVS